MKFYFQKHLIDLIFLLVQLLRILMIIKCSVSFSAFLISKSKVKIKIYSLTMGCKTNFSFFSFFVGPKREKSKRFKMNRSTKRFMSFKIDSFCAYAFPALFRIIYRSKK